MRNVGKSSKSQRQLFNIVCVLCVVDKAKGTVEGGEKQSDHERTSRMFREAQNTTWPRVTSSFDLSSCGRAEKGLCT